jgi:hypothetical protein
VRRCYSAGRVTGVNGIGGLIGVASNSLVQNSFWNMQISRQESSAGGTGLTTAQMKVKSNFTAAAWDFLGETTNGTDDFWRMCVDGVNYPKLTWSFVESGDFACPDGVKLDDFARLSQDWMKTYSLSLYGADADGDKTVDVNDLAILAANWLKGI